MEENTSGGSLKPGQTPLPVDAEKKTDSTGTGSTGAGSKSTGSVKTGDGAQAAGYGILGCISAAGIAALITWRRKR